MKAQFVVPVIVSILIIGTLGSAQDAFAPKKLFVGGLSWDAESQSFVVTGEMNHGMATAGENANFMLEVLISSINPNVEINNLSAITEWFFDDPINLQDPRKPYGGPVHWNRFLDNGELFQGSADFTVQVQILNPAGKPVAVAEPRTFNVEIRPPPDGPTCEELCEQHALAVCRDDLACFEEVFRACIANECSPPLSEENQKTKTINISHFKLDIDGDQISTPNGKWYEVSGGRETIDLTEMTSGKDDQGQSRPGQMYFADITLKGPFVSDRDRLDEWIGKLNESKPSQNTNDKNNPINVESQKFTVELNCALLESLGHVFVNQQTQTDNTIDDIIDLPPVPLQTTALVIHELVLSNVAIASSDTEIDPLSGWIFEDASESGDLRKNISVIIQKRDGSESTRFNFESCFLTEFEFPSMSASGTGNLYEEVTFKSERLELD